MNAFGRGAGPATTTSGTGKPSSNPGRFGVNHPRPPSPPPPPFTYPSPTPPWGPEAVEGVQSPPFAYESSGLAANAYQSNGIVRKPAVPGGVQSPPLAFQSSHPAAKITYPYVGAHRPIESPYIWVNGQRPINKDDGQANSRPAEVMPFVATHSTGTSLTSKITRFQDPKAAKFPVSHAMDAQISRYSGQTSLQRPALSPALFDQPKLPGPHSTMSVHQDRTPVLYSDLYDSGSSFNEADAHAAKRTRSPVLPVHEVFQEDAHIVQRESKRPSISPSRLGTGLASISSSSEALIPQRSVQSVDDTADEAGSTRSSSFPVAKRTRSPPVSADEALPGNFNFIQDDTERELQAKARRLERFKEELHEDGPNSVGQSFPISRYEQPKVEKQKHSGDIRMESGGDFCNGNNASDYEGSETPSMITGLCPDMCPESERAERERKGDLDQYERMDGDRNQTNRFLAVKKYNRTAEREATLIRPMPVLQKTVEYLLNLLDHPYDDKLLGIYNFLWDRMRAIRMDLRMQHIFNQEAINMLERMIRLHIIAMHELCKYTKGEGFSEGFDAHLNIEQMNKTSVELFQMYDDHQKKGINVPTEKEFRGYYALLKLDKHPGYKVEPAELSLDLAKMTPEIRQTPEVLFARNVARACRTGNFIAFFRLARKASYLQACLMHAHFAKLRTQALAALHSGLQINQGLPIMHVAKWLAMEGEDVESLLDYHGFLIKDYEEPYFVKEGQFLNDDKDYPTSCSKLVYLKRSRRIVEDVSPNVQVAPLSVEATTEIQLPKLYKHHDKKNVPSALGIWKNPPAVVEEEMPDAEVVPSPKVDLLRQPLMKQPAVSQQSPDCYRVAGMSISPWGISVAHSSSESQPAKPGGLEKPNNDAFFTVSPERKILSGLEVVPSPITPKTASHGMSSGSKRIEVSPFPTMTKTSFDGIGRMSPKVIHSFSVEKSVPEEEVVQNSEVEEPCHFIDDNECSDAVEENEDEEVFLAKIKLIIRLWRRRSAKLKELREQRQIAAEAALGTLFLGPQIRHMKDIRPSMAFKFDIDRVMRERYMKHQKLWSRLNISDVVGNTLSRRNPHAEFLYWKIILCSQIYSQAGEEELQRRQIKNMAAGPWLKSKLMPSKAEDDDNDELLVSSPALSIWKKWLPSQSGKDSACCFSFVKDVKLGVTYETVAGAGGVLFVVSESIPWNLQRIQLHDLVMSIPSGASLPLLVLSSCDGECLDPSSIVVNELGLCDIDKSRVNSFLVVSLTGDELMEGVNGFFSDKQLREGLQWLASESPQQPDLLHIKARELVLSHLNPSLSVLESRAGFELGPDHCISAFNEALDLSVREIIAAADANHARWPFPEILLLEYSCREWKILTRELPSLGWSSSEIIEPLLCAIRAGKLPSFTNGRSWSEEGTNNHRGIEDLKLQLESQLIEYLSQSAAMMGIQFAAKEAHVMVQRSTQLVLHGSTYFIIPNWIMVFKRIFNWRLMNLSSGPNSSVYVLRNDNADQISRGFDQLGLEDGFSSPHLSRPSLDEVINVGCYPLPLGSKEVQPEALQPPRIASAYDDAGLAASTGDIMGNEGTHMPDCALVGADDVDCRNRSPKDGNTEIILSGKSAKDTDRLSQLLEQCNLIQNAIDEKLHIYF